METTATPTKEATDFLDETPEGETVIEQDEQTTNAPDPKENSGGQQQPPADDTDLGDEGEPDHSEEDGDAAPPFDEALMRQAHDLGMTPEEAQAFGSETALRQAVAFLDKTLLSRGSQVLQQMATPAQPQAVAAPAPPATPQPQPTAQPSEAFKIEMDEDTLDDEQVKVFRAMETEINRLRQANHEIVAMRAQVAQMDQMLRTQAQYAAQAQMDRLVATLDQDEQSLVRSKPEVLQELQQNFVALGIGYHNAGLPVPHETELFRRASSLALGKHRIEKTRQQALDAQRDQRGRFIASPRRRDSKAAGDPREEAIREVNRKLREYGVRPVADEDL